MTVTTFGIIVASVLVGWFIGFLDSNLRTAKKIKAAETSAEIKIKEAEEKFAIASQQPEIQPDNPGLLRLKRDNGRYSLEVDGTVVTIPLSQDQKRRLIELITIFRPWLESGQPVQQTPQPAAPIQTPPAPAPVQPVVSRPVQVIAPKPDAEKNIKAMSIVNQIDSVLQARLADSPLANWGIRLQESPEGGVEVYVGNEKYASVDDVTDPVIKNTIRAAIAEWEQKFTPGL